MRARVLRLALLVLTLVVGAGCGEGRDAGAARENATRGSATRESRGDANGTRAGADASSAAPRRIVSLTPALTEILFALDLGDRVVGVTSFCDHPAEARTKTRIGGYVNPSVEAIVALEPDVVLVSPNTGNREAALAVERAGVTLVVVEAETLDDTYDAILETARVCGVEARGVELARSLRARVDAAAERVRDLPPVPVLFCLQIEPIIAAGRGTLPAEILRLAGGENVVDGEGYPRLGIETVIDRAPQMILQARMDTADEEADEKVLDYWRRWPAVPAVRDGKVRVIDSGAALRPGPRIAEAVDRLSRVLHPDDGGTLEIAVDGDRGS